MVPSAPSSLRGCRCHRTARRRGVPSIVLIGTRFLTITSTTPLLALMLGLAVGIDYALFIVSRHQDQLKPASIPRSPPRGRSRRPALPSCSRAHGDHRPRRPASRASRSSPSWVSPRRSRSRSPCSSPHAHARAAGFRGGGSREAIDRRRERAEPPRRARPRRRARRTGGHASTPSHPIAPSPASRRERPTARPPTATCRRRSRPTGSSPAGCARSPGFRSSRVA